jgi:hypothetical protein
MANAVFLSLLLLVLLSLCLLGGLSVYCPRALRGLFGTRVWRRPFSGPLPEGRPIEEIAGDLRRALAQREQLVRTQSSWYVVHDLRVSERGLHDLAEEAAGALGLGRCPAPMGAWTATHLDVRLAQLAQAGLVLHA